MAITVQKVADRLGRPLPTGQTAAQWQVWLDQADRQISRYQSLHGLADPDPGDRDDAILEAVAAMVLHPEDSTTVDVSVDDGRVAKTYKSGSGRIDMSDWWPALWPSDADDATNTSQAFSIRPYYEPAVPC